MIMIIFVVSDILLEKVKFKEGHSDAIFPFYFSHKILSASCERIENWRFGCKCVYYNADCNYVMIIVLLFYHKILIAWTDNFIKACKYFAHNLGLNLKIKNNMNRITQNEAPIYIVVRYRWIYETMVEREIKSCAQVLCA